MDENNLTPKQEAYCRARLRGLSQRAAYREAYPNAAKWKDNAVDCRASKLESSAKVMQRLKQLEEDAARGAKISRGKLLRRLDALADAAAAQVAQDRDKGLRIDQKAAGVLVSATRELLPFSLDDTPQEARFCADFALLITRDFLKPHRMIAAKEAADIWATGGRGSAKSSWASLEVVNYIEQHPDQHALVLMKYKNAIREAVYAQIVWAIYALGLGDEYDMPDSTFRIRKKGTGQLIIFRGCDNPKKMKSIKVPFGHIGITWYEEADMFKGMADIRTVNQSVTRGGADCIRLYTFNPPRSVHSWINVEMQKRADAGLQVFHSNYLNVPREWLGSQFFDDAQALKESDPRAYRHEYMGEPVGMGTEVFDPEKVVFRAVTDEEIMTFDNPRVGQDFGWYPDPWAVTQSEWQPGKMTLITYGELYANKVKPDEQARRIKKLLTYRDAPGDKKPAYHHIPVRSDDAEPTTIAQQRDAGIRARAAGKGNMRDASYRLLQACTWVIDPQRCPHLAQEVREKQYEVNKDGEVMNVIPDGHDHCIDATRYAVMNEARSRYAYRAGAKS